ncbi:GNAT family N-acetyltransferase [Pedobacter heparinus]|uniref:GNAT family N-acetyltransferase n=1 Tax=Pedobacter heparinus TaxID=984 RepID=UPI002931B8B9|nr:GNAT family N-acetyltransferase [Pedobacter heparinus]
MSHTENCLFEPKYQVVTDAQRWAWYMKQSAAYDIYHTLHYHKLDNRGEPILFVYEEEGMFIALPLLKRGIDGADFCDLTSSYGYAGPVSNRKFDQLSDSFMNNFKCSFAGFMRHNRAVSVFCRLNPFLHQSCLMEKMGGLRSNGRTVYIDLTQSLEAQRAGYVKRLQRQIRQLRKREYQIKDADSQEEIQLFTQMYQQNMRRLQAGNSYFYNEAYFSSLLTNSEFNCKLILVYEGEEMICGAVVVWMGGVIRNHLSATSESHVQFSPSKLLTDEISIIGRTLGMKFFHLGGGVGGKEDTLFDFKRSFSDLLMADQIWCYIGDEPGYNQLVAQKNIEEDKGYFPLYRNV